MRKNVLMIMMLVLTSPALAGCIQDDAAGEMDSAASAWAPGATAEASPVAPASAYRVEASGRDGGTAEEATAYPLLLPSNPHKPPVTIVKEGVFEPGDCSPSGDVDLPALNPYRSYDVSEGLEISDAFGYEISLTFTNTDESWGDIHLSYRIGGRYDGWFEPTGDQRGEVVLNFTGQSYRVSDDEEAWATVSCWHGLIRDPLSYTLSVTYTFVENGVPAEAPVQMRVPEGATRLFVTGVPLDPSRSVLSHYRVFGPDDELLCECALGSNEATDVFRLDEPGEYVVLVDHTADGFVALALDVPSEAPLVALPTAWNIQPLLTSQGGAVDETVQVEIPRVPLSMSMWYSTPSDLPAEAGFVKQLSVHVTSPRGKVFYEAHGGFAGFRIAPTAEGPRAGTWRELPTPGDWEEYEDHHAFDKGTHLAHVQAESFRGTINLWTRTYERA